MEESIRSRTACQETGSVGEKNRKREGGGAEKKGKGEGRIWKKVG